MFALVESGKITQFPGGNKGIQIGDVKYPKSIYTLWSEAERNAIGIYTIEIDNTNKKDDEWYINTNQTCTFSGGKVKATYGTATAKAIADADATDNEGNKLKDADGNQVIDYGLKTIKKRMIFNDKIKATNYQIDTYKKKVYIYGIALTSEEKDLVISEAKEILDVEDVIASIILVEDLRIQRE